MSYSEAAAKAAKAAKDYTRIVARAEKLEAEAQAAEAHVASLREQHAAAIRTGRRGIDPGDLEAARLAARASAENVDLLREEIEAAERAVALADRRAEDALREEWDVIAAKEERDLIEILRTRGAVAWRAALASGRSIGWRDFVISLGIEADGQQAQAPMPDLPEVHPATLDYERQEHWRRALRNEGL